VVLACTHYPLLDNQLRRIAPWPVTYVDPAPAIARRVLDLLGPAVPASAGKAGAQFVFTSGQKPAPALEAVFSRFG
jgi:glutamate racemase